MLFTGRLRFVGLAKQKQILLEFDISNTVRPALVVIASRQ
jgi:hypothetical protein